MEFGDALAAGALQKLCQNAPFPSGWNFALDQTYGSRMAPRKG
jgi:hypothetical protein